MRTLFCILLTLTVAMSLALSAGCSKAGKEKDKDKGTPPGTTPVAGQKGDGAEWLFAAPEEEYHMKVVVDAKEKKASVKILDKSAKEMVPIAAETILLVVNDSKDPLTITLNAQGEKGKATAQFAGTHDRLADKLDPKLVEVRAAIAKGPPHIFKLDEDHDLGPKKK